MGVADFLAAELAVDEHQIHPGVERAGTQQRVRRYEIVEAIALHVAQAIRRQRRFKLEDAGRAAGAEQLVDLGVVQIGPLEVDGHAVPLGNHPDGVVEHGERLEAQEVDLQHADVFEPHHVVLRDDRVSVGFGVGRGTDRDVVGERSRRDHDACRVHRRMARQAFDSRAQVEDFPDPFVLRRGRLDLGHLLARLLQRHAERRAGRNQLGEPFDVAHLDPQRACHVAEGRSRFQRSKRDDLADRLAAIALPRVLEDLAASLETKVEIDIRHRDALGIQEALEQQIEPEGIDIRDAQGVRDQRPGG